MAGRISISWVMRPLWAGSGVDGGLRFAWSCLGVEGVSEVGLAHRVCASRWARGELTVVFPLQRVWPVTGTGWKLSFPESLATTPGLCMLWVGIGCGHVLSGPFCCGPKVGACRANLLSSPQMWVVRRWCPVTTLWIMRGCCSVSCLSTALAWR